MKEKLVKVTEKRIDKFHRFLLQERIYGQESYTFSESELYDHYKEFAEEFGLQKVQDRHYVCSHLELYLQMEKQGSMYVLTNTEREKYLGRL